MWQCYSILIKPEKIDKKEAHKLSWNLTEQSSFSWPDLLSPSVMIHKA